jgi:hypothetical protein
MRANERVKDAPASALKAMFAGIGQLLGMADKLRGKSAAAPKPEAAAEPTAAEPAAQEAAAESIAPESIAPEAALAAEHAESEVAAAAAAPAKAKAPARPRAAAKPKAAAEPAAATPAAAEPAAVAEPAAAAATAELPLANYDELTVASLRARLRNLSADQLGQLIAYETSHAGRADVITMFERRVAKLAEG